MMLMFQASQASQEEADTWIGYGRIKLIDGFAFLKFTFKFDSQRLCVSVLLQELAGAAEIEADHTTPRF